MALRTFHSQGKVDWSAAWRIVLPATLGSAVGVYLTERVPNRDLGLIITAAVLIALILLRAHAALKRALFDFLSVFSGCQSIPRSAIARVDFI